MTTGYETTGVERATNYAEQLDVTLNAYRANMVGRVLVADDLYFKAFRLKLHAIVEEASRPAYTAPLTLPVFAVARAYEVPQTVPWQVRDGKDETTWHDLTDVTGCDRQGCEVRRVGPCVVLVSAAWGDGFAHMDDEGYVEVRIPAAGSGATA
jgi:hypothetical protein